MLAAVGLLGFAVTISSAFMPQVPIPRYSECTQVRKNQEPRESFHYDNGCFSFFIGLGILADIVPMPPPPTFQGPPVPPMIFGGNGNGVFPPQQGDAFQPQFGMAPPPNFGQQPPASPPAPPVIPLNRRLIDKQICVRFRQMSAQALAKGTTHSVCCDLECYCQELEKNSTNVCGGLDPFAVLLPPPPPSSPMGNFEIPPMNGGLGQNFRPLPAGMNQGSFGKPADGNNRQAYFVNRKQQLGF